jgi:hypothetical protein
VLNLIGYKDPNDTMERSKKPHIATITIKVDVRSIRPDGTFDDEILGDQALSKYGIYSKAQISISGYNEADCINKVKKLLEKLDG